MSTERIQTLLEGAFPTRPSCDVIDRGGGDHFEVHVTAPAFDGLTLIDQHRLVYDGARRALVGRHHPRAADQDERSTET